MTAEARLGYVFKIDEMESRGDMVYLTRIGHHPRNKRGTCARGYGVHAEGRVVRVLFGKVEVVGKLHSRIRWAHEPRKHSKPKSSTVKAARRLAKQLVNEQLRDTLSGGYQRQHRRIYRPSSKG